MNTHSHHDHRDHHHHHAPNIGRAFAIGIALNMAFVVIELVFGVMANSLALIADASHNFSDVLSLVLAGGAAMLARRPPSGRFTYGLRSSTILAALANAMILLVATGGIVWEAVSRFGNSTAINAPVVIVVALLGVFINAGTALLFLSERKSDLNARGAFLHMAADAGVSLGVVFAGLGIILGGWLWLDPVISLLIVAVVLIAVWGLLRDSLHLALHAAPPNIDPLVVRRYLCELPGVAEVHDLHIWAMSTTETALTAHLVMPAGHPGDEFFVGVIQHIKDHFHIGHTTIQVEMGTATSPCMLAPDHVV